MTKFYDYLLPTVAVFFVAAFMHIIRVQHIQLNLMLSLMLTYMIGMAAGAIFFTLKEEHISF
ncbi:hypothetical protein [uncultured Pontibacter sp.]|uniref:hypothetical protein n=1 Tax=uncultured Pontibacter sp. TaxID=453356 RepID=UPI00261BF51D|nr:hypothetical protein [uncultured Pontibacter sp.]